jgi:hypothetical protein
MAGSPSPVVGRSLTADSLERQRGDSGPADLVACSFAASVRAFFGSLLFTNSSGYTVLGSDAASIVFQGWASRGYNNTGSDGAVKGEAHLGSFWVHKASASQADVGKNAYAIGDDEVATTSTNTALVGLIIDWRPGNLVRVDPRRKV